MERLIKIILVGALPALYFASFLYNTGKKITPPTLGKNKENQEPSDSTDTTDSMTSL